MVKHIVMWRMAESEDKEQRAKDIKENLEALKGKINVCKTLKSDLISTIQIPSSDVVLPEFRKERFNCKITLNTKLSVQRMCVRM